MPTSAPVIPHSPSALEAGTHISTAWIHFRAGTTLHPARELAGHLTHCRNKPRRRCPSAGVEKLASPRTPQSTSPSPPAPWHIDTSWIPFTQDYRTRTKLSPKARLPYWYILAPLVLGLALLLQLTPPLYKPSAPSEPSRPPRSKLPLSPFGDSVYRVEQYYEQLEPGTRCRPKDPFALPVTDAITNMGLADEAKRVTAEFEFGPEAVNKAVKEFIIEMEEGLNKQGAMLAQIPTYVTAVPNGTEKGVYLAVDLGGTNFRVCSVVLHGNQTFSLQQSKVAVPRALMETDSAHELFAFLAKQIEAFLIKHHNDHFEAHQRKPSLQSFFDLGFTFSFPVDQVGISKGRLMRWTKGYDIQEAIGKDVCALLQEEIDALHLPVRVAALVNDTVGTLMARSYTSPGNGGAFIGAIFGTGTNGAYVEKLDKVKKMKAINDAEGSALYDHTTGMMIINTEWGSFDGKLKVMPNTAYDQGVDEVSVNPGVHLFEKRVSGMFLGEILRRALLALHGHPDETVALFKDKSSAMNDSSSTCSVADDSALFKTWGIDTSFLSIVEADTSDHLRITKQELDRYGVSAASTDDCVVVKMLVHAIGKRAARLAAVALAGVILSTGKLEEVGDDLIDIGVDGSLVEYYPGFEDYIREAFREIEGFGLENEKKVRIGLAKDGSGLGAALIALVAAKADMEGGF